MTRVKIITDSAADIPEEICRNLGIGVVPLTIRFGQTEYLDGVDLSNEKFWEMCLAEKELPQTAAPSPGQFQQAFEEARSEGYTDIVCITLSSLLSATYQSAMIAAETLGDGPTISVIDSKTATVGEGGLVIAAAEQAKDTTSSKAIVEMVESSLDRVRVFGTLDTLDHLKRGGRIGSAAALLGSLLSFKPLISVEKGTVEPDGRQRTRSRALTHLIDKVAGYPNISRLAVVHAQAPDLKDFVDRLSVATKTPVDDILIGEIGPVIGTHAGPGTLGISFWTD